MSIYNLGKFGKKLREIRKSLNLSQNKITEETGISDRTIRCIENGKVVPMLDTLEILSEHYKTDLISMLIQYRLDDYSVFCDIKNKIETKIDNTEGLALHNEIESLKILLSSTKNSYSKKLIRQLIIFTEAVIFCENNDSNEGLKKFIEAIKITRPTFKLEKYSSPTYSSMEIRILMNIAVIQRDLEMMQFCINSVESTNEIYPKLCYNLADLYIRNDDFQNALKYSDLGIKSCQDNRNYFALPILFYKKGFSECKLGNENFMKSLDTSMCLCDSFNKISLKNILINICSDLLNIKL